MPYIPNKNRELAARNPATTGELNYAFTKLIADYMRDFGGDYQSMNNVLGALEGAKLEFYRRVVGPYEDLAVKKNGDVY